DHRHLAVIPLPPNPPRASLPSPSPDPATTELYTLSLHDALPICAPAPQGPDPQEGLTVAIVLPGYHEACACPSLRRSRPCCRRRSEEHTSELQSPYDLVCRLLLEKKKKTLHIEQPDASTNPASAY